MVPFQSETSDFGLCAVIQAERRHCAVDKVGHRCTALFIYALGRDMIEGTMCSTRSVRIARFSSHWHEPFSHGGALPIAELLLLPESSDTD